MSGLILALLLVAIPVAAGNSSVTENSDVVQMNITLPAPVVPVVEVTTIVPGDIPETAVMTVEPVITGTSTVLNDLPSVEVTQDEELAAEITPQPASVPATEITETSTAGIRYTTSSLDPVLIPQYGIDGVLSSNVSSNFSANVTNGQAPLTVGFTDLSRNATGWAWYFGDESYTSAWQQMNANDGFTEAFRNGAVALGDGSIVYCPAWNARNETYRSTDNGETWQLVNSSGGWDPRVETYNSMVVRSNGTIVKMGGSYNNVTYFNDTWKSVDKGYTWQLVNASSGWSARANLVAVSLPDDSIVLLGGNTDTSMNDVWVSTNQGETWELVNASSEWAPRKLHSAVSLPDGSIVLMGGKASSNMNDTWRSTDQGKTWILVNASSGWGVRHGLNSVAMPDGSIVLLGGITRTRYHSERCMAVDG